MLFAAVAAALSSLVGVSANPIQAREFGGVLICTGANATGQCDYQVAEAKKCNQLQDPFYLNVGTFAVDGDNFFCWPHLYDCGSEGNCHSPTGCTVGEVNFTWPYKFNVDGVRWRKLFKSYDCHSYNK